MPPTEVSETPVPKQADCHATSTETGKFEVKFPVDTFLVRQ